jgi:hypothetical protein
MRNFARHILQGEALITPGPEGLRSLELANAIWLSAAKKKPVDLPLDRKAYDALLRAKRKTSKGNRDIKAIRQTDTQFKTK